MDAQELTRSFKKHIWKCLDELDEISPIKRVFGVLAAESKAAGKKGKLQIHIVSIDTNP
jgi:hypothetical protein